MTHCQKKLKSCRTRRFILQRSKFESCKGLNFTIRLNQKMTHEVGGRLGSVDSSEPSILCLHFESQAQKLSIFYTTTICLSKLSLKCEINRKLKTKKMTHEYPMSRESLRFRTCSFQLYLHICRNAVTYLAYLPNYIPSAAHILKLEGYREDQHDGSCARMSRKIVKRSTFIIIELNILKY